MIKRETICFKDRFNRAQVFSTTPGQNGWTIADTSSSGTPTYLCVTEDGGAAKLTLAATSEAEIVTLYHNDVLVFDLASVHNFYWIAKVAGIDSATTLTLGMGSARNDTDDSVAVNAYFRLQGSASLSALVVETDDGTTDLDDKATGVSLASNYVLLLADFTYGLSDVRFYANGARVAASTPFDMSAISSGQNVQPLVQIQKASGTGTPSVTLAEFGCTYEVAYGA